MDKKEKDSYMAGGIFVLVGILTIYVYFSSNSSESLILILGFLLMGVGGLSFKYPKIGEILFHWLQQQSESGNNSQHQHKTKNSNQVATRDGNVTINQHFYKKPNYRKRKKNIKRNY